MADRPITGYQTYYTVEGDSFDIIALMQYDDEKAAHYIIQENPDYSDVLIFEAGVELQLPVFGNVALPNTLPPWRRGE